MQGGQRSTFRRYWNHYGRHPGRLKDSLGGVFTVLWPEVVSSLLRIHKPVEDHYRRKLKLAEREGASAERQAHLWWSLAQTLQRRRMLPEARQAYLRAAALQPDDFDIQLNLAWLLESMGHFGQAAAAFRGALRLLPEESQGLASTIAGEIERLAALSE